MVAPIIDIRLHNFKINITLTVVLILKFLRVQLKPTFRPKNKIQAKLGGLIVNYNPFENQKKP